MIDFTINTDTYFLPQQWEETSYDQYRQIRNLPESLTNQELAVHIIHILSGVPLQVLNEAPFEAIIPLWNKLTFVIKEPAIAPTEYVTIDGTNYYAHSIQTTGEFVTFDKIQVEMEGDTLKQIPYILAILLRKKMLIGKPEPEKSLFKRIFGSKNSQNQPEFMSESLNTDADFVAARADLFTKRLNTVQIMSLAAFFLTKENESRTVIPSYSKLTLKVLKKSANLVSISSKSTVGSALSMTLNRTYAKLMNYYLKMLTTS